MELFKITGAVKSEQNISWNRVVDVLVISDDGDAWNAHEWLEERGEYPFIDTHGDQVVLTRM